MLQDGTHFEGIGFGATKKFSGEITFSTIPGAGYIEVFTDSAYKDKIVVFTYTSIGNYGVPRFETDKYGIPKFIESDSVKLGGIVVTEYCKDPSHYESVRTLEDYMIREGVPGIQWVDTRWLTQILCEEGSKLGVLKVYNQGEKPNIEELKAEAKKVEDPNFRALVSKVSVNAVKKFVPENPIGKVVVLDLGAKNNIFRLLLGKKIEVNAVPYNYSFNKINQLQPDGIIISNGPGNPIMCKESIEIVKEIIGSDIPVMGIGLGSLLIGIAAGGKTYKLKAEHRGDRTVVQNSNNKCFITYHNHGYSVKEFEKLGFKEYFHDIDDNTNEGLIHESKPIFSVLFNPEAAPGPLDTQFLFDEFIKLMEV